MLNSISVISLKFLLLYCHSELVWEFPSFPDYVSMNGGWWALESLRAEQQEVGGEWMGLEEAVDG